MAEIKAFLFCSSIYQRAISWNPMKNNRMAIMIKNGNDYFQQSLDWQRLIDILEIVDRGSVHILLAWIGIIQVQIVFSQLVCHIHYISGGEHDGNPYGRITVKWHQIVAGV